MPAVSKAQFGYMGAVLAGKAKKKGGPSKAQAREFVKGVSPKNLPARAKKKSKKSSKKGGY